MLDRFCIAFAIAFIEIVEIFAVVLTALVMIAFGIGAFLYFFVMLVVPNAAALLMMGLCLALCALSKMVLNYLTSEASIFERKTTELRLARARMDASISAAQWDRHRRV